MNFVWEPTKATLLLPIHELAIHRKVVEYADRNGYFIKQGLHLTILSFQNGKKLLQGVPSFVSEIPGIAETFHWTMQPIVEYFVLERTIPEFVLQGVVQTPRHTRRSIIQKVSVPALAEFFAALTEKVGISFDMPVAHVTLFTWSDRESEKSNGIALNSQADFEKYLKEEIVL